MADMLALVVCTLDFFAAVCSLTAVMSGLIVFDTGFTLAIELQHELLLS